MAAANHEFSRQIVKFSTLAKPTQPKYGTIRIPAAIDFGQNAMVVAKIATKRATTSMKAAPGMWKPKNNHDQAAFKINWTANKAIAHCQSPPCRHTSHAATAIEMQRAVQTGPKIQFGGFHVGFAKPAYQVGMFGAVAIEPMAAAANVTTRKRMRAAI